MPTMLPRLLFPVCGTLRGDNNNKGEETKWDEERTIVCAALTRTEGKVRI